MGRRYEPEANFYLVDSSEENSTTKHKSFSSKCCLDRLVEAYNEIYKFKEWMVPIGDVNSKIDGKLIGETIVISGPAQSGKASLVYWALRQDVKEETAIVTVDCSLYRTQMQFIQKLTRQIGEKIGEPGLDRRVVVSQNIKFSDLNATIRNKNRPVVILIRNAERLVEYRKQILMYNLLEWIMTDVKKYIGLVFTTRLIYFVDRFQKRIRSRLSAKQLTVNRPSPQSLLLLLSRRVQCLVQEERQEQQVKFFEKILRCLCNNKGLVQVIRLNQEIAQKDIVFYLNAMKLVFASFHSEEEIIDMDESALKAAFCQKMQNSFEFIFPYIPKNLLKTCSYPQFIIMAIIHYMSKHERTPYRFKTVYQIYLEFTQKLIACESSGSSFLYTKTLLERAVMKLHDLNLIQLQSKDESLWNCEIRCCIYPQDLKKTFQEINNTEGMPIFIMDIISS